MHSYQQAQKNIIANTQRWVLHSKTLSISIKYVECCNQIHISANSWLAHSEFQGLEQPPPPSNPPPPNLCFSLRELNGQGLCKPVIYYSTFFSIVVSSTSQILRFLKTWNLTASQIECFFVNWYAFYKLLCVPDHFFLQIVISCQTFLVFQILESAVQPCATFWYWQLPCQPNLKLWRNWHWPIYYPIYSLITALLPDAMRDYSTKITVAQRPAPPVAFPNVFL